MRKIFLWVFAVLLTMASCSSDELVNDVEFGDDGIETKSAKDKIFSLEEITSSFDDAGSYTQNIMCSDLEGNLYYFDRGENVYQGIVLKKYNAATKEITTILELKDMDNFMGGAGAICVDNLQDIYLSTAERVFKFSQTDNNLTDITSRFPTVGDGVLYYGICAADNGNVFVGTEEWNGANTIQNVYKISAKGKITLVTSDVNYGDYYFKGGGLVKPKGAFVYTTNYNSPDNRYFKIATTKGEVTKMKTRPDIIGLSAALNKANAYGLASNDIYQLRPNNTSDLLVGTIPFMVKNEQNGYDELRATGYFCINPDATVFYVALDKKIGDYYYKGGIYKLTLE